MMRKLLYSFLFPIFKSFPKRLFTPNLGLLCIGMFFVVNFANAQATTSTWALTANPNAVTTGNVSASAMTIGSGLNNLSYTAASGVSTGSWSNDASSLRATEYYEFKVTPAAGYTLNVTNINFQHSVSSGDWQVQAYYSTDNFATSTALSNAFSSSSTTPTARNTAISIPSITTSITIRIYGWESDGNNRSLRIRNFVVNGTTSCPPVTISNAGPDQNSNTSFSLAANTPSVGTGAWTIVSGPSTALSQFSSTSSPNATFTPIGTGTYTLRWTISSGCDTSTDDVVLVANCVSNLIKNGDFSLGTDNWTRATTMGTTAEVLNEDVYFGTTNTANRTAELDSEASLRQDVTVIPNVSYTLSFIYARRPGSPSSVAVDVKLFGGSTASVNYTTNIERTPFVGTLTFTPTTSSVGIEFYNSLGGNSTLGAIVDNIVLIPSSLVAPVATTNPKGDFGTLSACAGVPIGLDVENITDSNVTYEWTSTSPGAVFSSTTIKNPTVTFTGSGLQNATVKVTTQGGCSGTPSTTYVNVKAAPTVYNVTGGGSYCSGGTGFAVNLSGSAASGSGVTYQLQLNGVDNGAAVAATGSAINFGVKTVAGTYTVIAKNSANCALNMNGNAVITVNPAPTLTGASQAASVCSGSAATINLTGLLAGSTSTISYSINNVAQTAITSVVATGTGTASFTTPALTSANNGQTLQITGVTTTSSTPNCSSSFTRNVTLAVNATPTLTGATQAAAVCSGSAATINLSGLLASSTSTIAYTIGGVAQTPITSVVATGTGTASFTTPVLTSANNGQTLQITGVTTTNSTPNCNASFTRNVTLVVNPTPTLTNATQAAAVCSGSAATINLTGLLASSTSTITYTIDGVAQTSITSLVATAGGTASFTTPALASANNGKILRITGVTTTSSTPNCSSTFAIDITLAVNPTPTLTGASQPLSVCTGSAAVINLTGLLANSTSTISYTINGVAQTQATSVVATGTGTASFTTRALTFADDAQTLQITQISATSSTPNCSSTFTRNVTLSVNPLPNPTVAKDKDFTCESGGSVTLSNLPANWTINQSGQASQTITGTTSSCTITGLAAGNYNFTVTNNTSTCTSAVAAITINNQTSSTTWNGSGWSNGLPDGNKSIIIAVATSVPATQPFTTATPDIYGCSLTVNAGAVVTIPSDVTLHITNIVATNGQLIFENNSSLLQTTNAVNTGNIVYKRATSIRRFDLTYWSSPVTKAGGFTMHDFSPTTLGDKYFYFNPSSGWTTNMNGTMPMETGNGYSIRGPQEFDTVTPSIFTGTFTGVPNNGDITVTGVATSAGATTPIIIDKFFLFGNPYPSAIDAEKLLAANQDVLGPLYFWTHVTPPQRPAGDNTYRYSSNDYTVFTLAGSTDITGTIAKSFGGKIAAGQGFIAKPKATQIHFNNGMRVGGTDNREFFKTAKTTGLEKNRLWLNIKNAEGAFKQILVGYIEGATNNVDFDYDATTLGSNTYIDFYSISETKKLTIQARALPFDNTDSVPLGYKTSLNGDFTIGIDHADGFFDSQEVYLEDKTTGKVINLRNENYTFSTVAGTFTDRFALRYTSKTLGTGDFEDLESSVLVSVKNKVVSITSSKETIKDVNIFNVGAQLLYSKNKVNAQELQIANLHSSDQVLLVKITLENGSTVTKKVIFSNL